MGHADLLSLFVLAYFEKEQEHPHLLHAAQLGVKDVYESDVRSRSKNPGALDPC